MFGALRKTEANACGMGLLLYQAESLWSSGCTVSSMPVQRCVGSTSFRTCSPLSAHPPSSHCAVPVSPCQPVVFARTVGARHQILRWSWHDGKREALLARVCEQCVLLWEYSQWFLCGGQKSMYFTRIEEKTQAPLVMVCATHYLTITCIGITRPNWSLHTRYGCLQIYPDHPSPLPHSGHTEGRTPAAVESLLSHWFPAIGKPGWRDWCGFARCLQLAGAFWWPFCTGSSYPGHPSLEGRTGLDLPCSGAQQQTAGDALSPVPLQHHRLGQKWQFCCTNNLCVWWVLGVRYHLRCSRWLLQQIAVSMWPQWWLGAQGNWYQLCMLLPTVVFAQ